MSTLSDTLTISAFAPVLSNLFFRKITFLLGTKLKFSVRLRSIHVDILDTPVLSISWKLQFSTSHPSKNVGILSPFICKNIGWSFREEYYYNGTVTLVFYKVAAASAYTRTNSNPTTTLPPPLQPLQPPLFGAIPASLAFCARKSRS